jgi:hypothetical protein
MWRTTFGARRFSRPGSMTGVWTVERYMETSGSLEQKGTPEGSTSLVPGSLVSPIVTPDRDLERVIPEIFGPTHGRSFGWWDRNGSCLRTYQASFLEMTDGKALGSVYLGSFPNWGFLQDGEFIAQPTPAARISGSGGGSWPTPAASSGGTHTGISAETARNELARGNQIGLGAAVALWPTPRAGKTTGEEEESWRARNEEGKVNTPPLGLAVKMWPTPRAIYGEHPGMKDTSHLTGAAQMWATPNTFDAVDAKSQEALDHEHESARPGRSNPNNLRDQIAVSEGTRFWATPTGDDANNVTRASRDFQSLSREVEGSLNPDWVEQHLMSLPEGWTKLEPVPDGAYDEWFDAMRDGTWWDTERGLPRVTTGVENRVNRLRMLGNGIVPATLALFLKGSNQ